MGQTALPRRLLALRGGVQIFALFFGGRSLGDWTQRPICLLVCWGGNLAQRTEELFYREANPKGQFKQRLFVMVIDEFATIWSN